MIIHRFALCHACLRGMSSFGEHQIFSRNVKSPFLGTRSNAFVRSTKAMWSGLFYSILFEQRMCRLPSNINVVTAARHSSKTNRG